jgi:hypothetical protein
MEVTKRFHRVMQELLDSIRAKRPDESSIAAHLLDIKDPDTGDHQDDLPYCLLCCSMSQQALHARL